MIPNNTHVRLPTAPICYKRVMKWNSTVLTETFNTNQASKPTSTTPSVNLRVSGPNRTFEPRCQQVPKPINSHTVRLKQYQTSDYQESTILCCVTDNAASCVGYKHSICLWSACLSGDRGHEYKFDYVKPSFLTTIIDLIEVSVGGYGVTLITPLTSVR